MASTVGSPPTGLGTQVTPTGSLTEDSSTVTEESPTVMVTVESTTFTVTEETSAVVVTGETPTIMGTEHSPTNAITKKYNADAGAEEIPTDMDPDDQDVPIPNSITTNDSFTKNVHQIFHRNQYTDTYQIDERMFKEIVHNNVHCSNANDKMFLMMNYKNPIVKSF